MIKFYGYSNCSTCSKALKELKRKKVVVQEISIVEQAPTKKEILLALKQKGIEMKHLLNTSGVLYREMGLKDKIPQMSRDEVVDLLSRHGKLVKRPFITDGVRVTLGFREAKLLDIWG